MKLIAWVLKLSSRFASGRVVMGLAIALALATGTASWALWHMASDGARCDGRVDMAVAAGAIAARDVVSAQETEIERLRTEDESRLQVIKQLAAVDHDRRITVYRDRVREVPVCSVNQDQIDAINTMLR